VLTGSLLGSLLGKNRLTIMVFATPYCLTGIFLYFACIKNKKKILWYFFFVFTFFTYNHANLTIKKMLSGMRFGLFLHKTF
jgi:hypothetical protein